MIVWGVSKFTTTSQSVKLYKYFYGLDLDQTIPKFMGAGELLVAALILLGLFRLPAYGAGLLIHLTTILIVFPKILDPFVVVNGFPQNRSYAAGVAALAAFAALVLLRRHDGWSLDAVIRSRRSKR